jgi:hypothetical protein
MLWMIRSVPTIPLYNSNPAHPDASHDVRSPGGYEWWHFDAEDAQQDIQIVGVLAQGYPFHPGYLRRYFRYLRAPTRRLPPLPQQYPCAHFAVYRGGRLLHQFINCYSAGSLIAHTQRPQVSLGPNEFVGGPELMLSLSGAPSVPTALGAKVHSQQRLGGQFNFSPLLTMPPFERIIRWPQLRGGGQHHWVLTSPLCAVRGTIRCNGAAIDFNGLGYHDHRYGTAPAGACLKRGLRGRVVFDDTVCAFHFARSAHQSLPDDIHLLECTQAGVHECRIGGISADWSARTGWMLRYPRRVDFADVLRLENPKVLDSSPWKVRLLYQAQHRGRAGRALCEIDYPRRLQAPLLGRLIERSMGGNASPTE